ncbi:MAG TPA: glycosyl transferase family 1, partial [Phycisphaerales bacterium]|nr:glycosyl transferase family 1 [Phycisphaerales bacterium]
MKIAYVCTDPGVPVFGCKGGSIHVQSVVRALLARGAEVVLFARRLGGEPPSGLESVAVRKLSKAPKGQTAERERFLLDANEELREMLGAEPGVDLVYERYSLFSYAAMEYARNAGIAGLLEVNALLIEEQQRYRSLTLVSQAEEASGRCLAAAGSVLAVSRTLADRLERETAARGRVHVVPNGVDIARFGPLVEPSLPGEEGQVTIG